jgi:hypothetical protein
MRRNHPVSRLLAAVALLFGIVVATPGAATAAPPYPAPPAPGQVSSTTIFAGRPVTFSGRGFRGNEKIRITQQYRGRAAVYARTARAAPGGTFRTAVTLRQPGVVSLRAYGHRSGRTVTAVVRVVNRKARPSVQGAERTRGNAGLPITGASSVLPIALGGALLLTVGLGLVGVTARRRRHVGHG